MSAHPFPTLNTREEQGMQYNTEGLEIWESTYKPIKNSFGERGWNGLMFETHGKDLEFILKQNPQNVWTWWDTENGSSIAAGYHLVNRIGYFVTEKQWTEPMESYDVEISEEDELVDL